MVKHLKAMWQRLRKPNYRITYWKAARVAKVERMNVFGNWKSFYGHLGLYREFSSLTAAAMEIDIYEACAIPPRDYTVQIKVKP